MSILSISVIHLIYYILLFLLIICTSCSKIYGQSEIIDSLQRALHDPTPEQEKLDIYCDLSYYLLDFDVMEAWEVCKEGRNLAKKYNDTANWVCCLINAGAACVELGYTHEATQLNLRLYDIASFSQDSATILQSLLNLAVAVGEIDHRQAIQYYQQVLHISDQYLDTQSRIIALHNMALEYDYLEMPDSLLFFHRKAHALSQSYSQSQEVIYPQTSLAQALVAQGKIEEVPSLLKKATTEALMVNSHSEIIYAYCAWSDYYIKRKEWEDAYNYITKAQPYADTLQSESYQADLVYYLYLIEKGRGHRTLALAHLQAYTKIQEGLFTQAQERQINYRLKEFERDRQERIQQNLEESSRQQRVMIALRWALSGGGVLGVISLSFFLMFLYDQNKRLKKQHEVLQEISHEKDQIIHAIAHDLKAPVANIHQLSHMLIEEGGFHEDVKEVLLMVQNEAGRSHEWLLNWGKLKSLENVSHEAVTLAIFIRTFSATLASKGIQPQWKIIPKSLNKIKFYVSDDLKQILRQFLQNPWIQSSPHQDVSIQVDLPHPNLLRIQIPLVDDLLLRQDQQENHESTHEWITFQQELNIQLLHLGSHITLTKDPLNAQFFAELKIPVTPS